MDALARDGDIRAPSVIVIVIGFVFASARAKCRKTANSKNLVKTIMSHVCVYDKVFVVGYVFRKWGCEYSFVLGDGVVFDF